jgi:uncharacterized membrane protein YfhO
MFDLQSLGCIIDGTVNISICPYTQIFKTLLNIKTNNKYHLEKIFTSDNKILNIGLYDGDYFVNQNLLFKTITNTENNYITKEKLSSIKNEKNKYKVTKNGIYYLNLKGTYQVITINDTAYTYDPSLISNQELKINEIHGTVQLELDLKKNDIIEIIYPSEEEIEETLEIYYFDKNIFEESYNKLKQNQIEYISYQDNKIEGTIKVEDNQIIFTSIPYDKHWKVTIDGKEAKTIRILNSLLGIECEPGMHTIKLEYKTNYVIPILISTTTLITLITKIIIERKKQKKSEN